MATFGPLPVPPMPPTSNVRSEVLLDAMTHAMKTGVLFLVSADEDIEMLAQRTRRLTMQVVMREFGANAAQQLFKESGNDWVLKPSLEGSRGWLFFYPAEMLKADEDANNPTYVYWPDANGVYERVSYGEWQRLRFEGHVWRPDPKKLHQGPRSAWDRIRDLEPEPEK